MDDQRQNANGLGRNRIRLTIGLEVSNYDAIAEIQRIHRRRTGKTMSIGAVINQAVNAYARSFDAAVGE